MKWISALPVVYCALSPPGRVQAKQAHDVMCEARVSGRVPHLKRRGPHTWSAYQPDLSIDLAEAVHKETQQVVQWWVSVARFDVLQGQGKNEEVGDCWSAACSVLPFSPPANSNQIAQRDSAVLANEAHSSRSARWRTALVQYPTTLLDSP